MARTVIVSSDRPGAVPTVREALEITADGGTISLTPGEYREALVLRGRDVTLSAADGPGTVVLLSDSSESVLRLESGTVTLADLTLRGGYGAAITVDGGELKANNCEISAEFGVAVQVGQGARLALDAVKITNSQYGLSLEGCSGTVKGSTVEEIGGDGIIVSLGADPVISDTTVRNCGNRGIYIYQYGKPTIANCEVIGTRAVGIAIAHGSSPTIRGTAIRDTDDFAISADAGCGGVLDGCKVDSAGMSIDPGATLEIIEAAVTARVGVGADTGGGGQEKVEELLAEMDSLIGLAEVKAEVRSLIDEMQVSEWRRLAGLGSSSVSRHLIFAGAPGTGKTTVARLYGKLLFALGVLPKDTLKEVSRRDLVGQYIGHTAEKTAGVFNEALGGVLFIDEAYTLSRSAGSGADFGQESIDMLVKLMEDHRDEVAVIAAGYTADMVDFLAANAGLASRFTRTIEFKSYSAEELGEITIRIAEADSYVLSPEVLGVLVDHFTTIDRGPNFGNAREARTLFEGVRKFQAQRLRALGRMPSMEDLRTIAVADVLAAIQAR
ncbi:right-handed parallel beta-helix repeat-containing protein [Actinoplanes sp. NPDC051861]|uniref:right-handed parallel beta-helix repeat-containing protein n=1 Tax=Actinoplanes sp. NPDC051861 TaxID=3155170 RepID=UPI003418C8EC